MTEDKENKKGMQNQHNNYVVQCMEDTEFGIEFYNRYLANYAKNRFDPDSIVMTRNHHVSNEFADYYTDVLYQGRLKNYPEGSLGYIYLLCEHKSTAVETTNVQIATYMMNIVLMHLREHPKSKFPVILPMVLYHGKKTPYPYSLNWLDIFDDPDHLMGEVFTHPIHLIDLNTYSDDTLKQFKLVGVMSQLLKHIRDPDLAKFLPDIFNSIKDIWDLMPKDGQNTTFDAKMLNFIKISLSYVFVTAPKLKEANIINELASLMVDPVRKEVMSLADVLREEGFEKGQAKGREEGREEVMLETARNMLQMGAEDSFILKATCITQEQLEFLKRENTQNSE